MGKEIRLSLAQVENLKHTIGWNYNNQPRKRGRSKYPILNAYRNYFYGEDRTCEELVEMGLMHKRPLTLAPNSRIVYDVTELGFETMERFFGIKIKRED